MALPGIVEPKEGLVYGAETIKCIKQFRTSLTVVGASGIDERGVSEALLHAAQVYAAMIEAADETLVLADSSKFESRSLQQILLWNQNVRLVSETPPSGILLDAIHQGSAKIVTG